MRAQSSSADAFRLSCSSSCVCIFCCVSAGLISPWNLPLYLLTWKIAPAIAAGNTVVAKPSEMTSVTAWMLCKLMEQAGRPGSSPHHPAVVQLCTNSLLPVSVCAGVPPGVVNIVFGTGPKAGSALVSHPEVPLISFTGSTATARVITELSAPYCKKLSLELGGKNPALVFADADLDQVIETSVRSSFSNQVTSVVILKIISKQRHRTEQTLSNFGECINLVKKLQ